MLEQIGRYEIQSELGRGGMATVYLAFDPHFQREVAIKVLPRQFTHDPRFLKRFEQEARMIAALEEPAIVPVHDFGEFDDAPYLVMRFMAGGTLRKRIGGKPMALYEISRILNRLAPALDEAHLRGIIHRDLKPDNVLFDRAGRPYLADFGIARMAEATHTMTLVGTPGYMSPEQVQGKLKLDWRSDIYALGVMLFEMLSGRQPYEAETPAGQMMMHIMEPVPDILADNPNLPEQGQLVIDKVMAKDREERYQTAGGVAQVVRQLLTALEPDLAPENQIAATTILADEKPIDVMEQELEPVESSSSEMTILDTAPDKTSPAAIPVPATVEKIEEDTTTTSNEDWQGTGKSKRRQARIWWVPAIVLAILVPLGIRYLLQAEPVLGSEQIRETDEMPMVYVPSGTFEMGSTSGRGDEMPRHKVALDGFWIDKTEVTNAQYEQCVISGRCKQSSLENDANFNGDDKPVVGVNWNEADSYCRWAGGHLPTEAQWEYAAGGIDGYLYPWGEAKPTCELAQFSSCLSVTIPADNRKKGASWVGALGLAGNVFEWVNDWYDQYTYEQAPLNNPAGPESGREKVIRGGGWRSSSLGLRTTSRSPRQPVVRASDIGFRCAVP